MPLHAMHELAHVCAHCVLFLCLFTRGAEQCQIYEKNGPGRSVHLCCVQRIAHSICESVIHRLKSSAVGISYPSRLRRKGNALATTVEGNSVRIDVLVATDKISEE